MGYHPCWASEFYQKGWERSLSCRAWLAGFLYPSVPYAETEGHSASESALQQAAGSRELFPCPHHGVTARRCEAELSGVATERNLTGWEWRGLGPTVHGTLLLLLGCPDITPALPMRPQQESLETFCDSERMVRGEPGMPSCAQLCPAATCEVGRAAFSVSAALQSELKLPLTRGCPAAFASPGSFT